MALSRVHKFFLSIAVLSLLATAFAYPKVKHTVIKRITNRQSQVHGQYASFVDVWTGTGFQSKLNRELDKMLYSIRGNPLNVDKKFKPLPAWQMAELLVSATYGGKEGFRDENGKMHPRGSNCYLSMQKFVHDLEQWKYLQKRRPKDISPEFVDDMVTRYTGLVEEFSMILSEGVHVVVPCGDETGHDARIRELLKPPSADLVLNYHQRMLYHHPTVGAMKQVLNTKHNMKDIEDSFVQKKYATWDDFILDEAIEKLHRFCMESTIWFDSKTRGYMGAYMNEGMSHVLLTTLAAELTKNLPRVIQGFPLRQLWAYKYSSVGNHDGIGWHADGAAVNLNFWITPSEANLDPESGGLVVFLKRAPESWGFDTWNDGSEAGLKRLHDFASADGNTPLVVPHRRNRIIMFRSDLIHRTDNYSFKPGYENRRINVTMLFGDRADIKFEDDELGTKKKKKGKGKKKTKSS